MAEYHLYGGLCRTALWDSALPDEREQHSEPLLTHQRQLEIWAQHCPENFENRAALLGAEIARIEGRDLDAMRLYEHAIRSAHANGFVQNEALAYEVGARFYLARGIETIGHAYLRNAKDCYHGWGAVAKVKQLDQLYPHLQEEPLPISANATIATVIGEFDVMTIVKASQALSSEMVLTKLIESLMRIAVEQAVAEP